MPLRRSGVWHIVLAFRIVLHVICHFDDDGICVWQGVWNVVNLEWVSLKGLTAIGAVYEHFDSLLT